jgi:purine-cytosine permease-like protein
MMNILYNIKHVKVHKINVNTLDTYIALLSKSAVKTKLLVLRKMQFCIFHFIISLLFVSLFNFVKNISTFIDFFDEECNEIII